MRRGFGSGRGDDDRTCRRVRKRELIFQAVIAGHGLRISAEENVRAAAGHVGRYRYGAFAARLGNDDGFALVLLGVQNLVRNSGFLQVRGNFFRFFDGDAADQHRLAAFVVLANAADARAVLLQDAVHRGFEFFGFRAIDHVGIFNADERAVGRNRDHFELVNLIEFGSFGISGSGHSRKVSCTCGNNSER